MRSFVVAALTLSILAAGCKRSSADSAPSAAAAECATVQKALEPIARRLEAVERSPAHTVPEMMAKLNQLAQGLDDALAQLAQLEPEDAELIRRLDKAKDAFVILSAMMRSLITNIQGGFISSVEAQVKELERFEAQAMAAADAVDTYCGGL